ncbi:chromosome partitioning protein [Hasllibacter halocynthiae]|uniref:Chromosome partitioning protein n=1 Tax=Hasllibacter halocynthiae TaxID=595589 RepID=A0A2T0X3K4_9RHOB|nr:division plane positioning ATPase MipZ [Hasllibacter halocynthiae]PRY93533.1 chromosome partitioning protein [Hasllibacter halocynthiae]
MTHIIVVGNEKGGSGKSTTAMHIATALARMGQAVAALDLDLRQKSMARYLANRAEAQSAEGVPLPCPTYVPLPEPREDEPADDRLSRALEGIAPGTDFVVIDCPGSHTSLSQVAHTMADTLVTPLNDSFVDFDLLAKVDRDGKVRGPSIYSEMVWNARQARSRAGLPPIDWIVVRNRLGAQKMLNKAKMEQAVGELGRRIGFRAASGFSERVVFRELFPRGLTLLDLRDVGAARLNVSNISARNELRDLMRTLQLPGVEIRV